MEKPDRAAIERVMAQRAKRTAPRFAPVNNTPGAHVWAASGLKGWPGSSETNVFAQSGLADAYAALRAKQRNPNDWVPIVANAMKEKR